MESPTMVKEEAPSTPSPKTEDDDVSNAVLEARKKLGITIGRNDVLFGRGGLTNRHHGNKRYRDVINQFRQEYTDATKTEKPRVAKRVVKTIIGAISSTDSPARFLKRDDDGVNWVEVDEQEAALKVSQALREKTRWSCMKNADEDAATSINSENENSMEASSTKKRNSSEAFSFENDGKVLKVETTDKESGKPTIKKIAVGNPGTQMPVVREEFLQLPKRSSSIQTNTPFVPAEAAPVPTADRIVVPPLETSNSSTILSNDASVPTDSDVLFGRGGRTNHHPGNKRLRTIVDQYKVAYERARKTDKPRYAKAIVQALRQHATAPSRFLRIDEKTNQWVDVGDRRAAEKVSQTLREKEKVRYAKKTTDELLASITGVVVQEQAPKFTVVTEHRTYVTEEVAPTANILPPQQAPTPNSRMANSPVVRVPTPTFANVAPTAPIPSPAMANSPVVREHPIPSPVIARSPPVTNLTVV